MKRMAALLAVLFLSACNLQAELAPTETSTPNQPAYPTVTMPPPAPPTPSASATLPASPTPTPDLRVITAPAQNFKLTLGDLPRGYDIEFVPLCGDSYDAQCGLASDRIEGPNLNYEVLQEYGTELGGQYINATRRIEGWYIYYHYQYSYEDYPQVIMNNIIRFESAEGARAHIQTYADKLGSRRYAEVTGYPQTGDASRAFIRQFYGDKYLVYEFAYRNMVQRLWFFGTEQNIAPNLIQDLSFKALLKLQAAELSLPVGGVFLPTLTPMPDAPAPEEQIVAAKPETLTLTAEDLPAEGKYRLAGKGASSPHRNQQFTQDYPNGQGSAYLADTGRLNGWDVIFKRGKNDVLLPTQVTDKTSIFESAAGAQKHVTTYAHTFLPAGWYEDKNQAPVGDTSRIFFRQQGVHTECLLVFSYRNVAHELTLYGLDAEVNAQFAQATAYGLIRNLQTMLAR